MDGCSHFRYFLVALVGLALCLTMCFRVAFVLVVTHTTRANASDVSDVKLFPHCTTYNTSQDYVNDFSKETTIQFHTVYFVGIVTGTTGSGHLTSRFPSHVIIGIGTLSASLLFIITPSVFQHSSVGIFIIRFLQGFMEGMIQPAAIFLVVTWSLKHEKSALFAVAFLGILLGPGICNILIGACICYVSWDSGIYILGASGTLLALVWGLVSTSTPKENRFVGAQELEKFANEGEEMMKGSKTMVKIIPWLSIVKSIRVWAIWFSNFSKIVLGAAFITLLPQYFKDEFKIKVADIGLLLSVPYFIGTVCLFMFSIVADRIIRSDRLSTTNVRKLMQCTGMTIETTCVVCVAYSTSWKMAYAFMVIAYSLGWMTFSGSFCNIVDLSPQCSGAVGAMVSTSLVGGAVITLISSFLVGAGGNWTSIFWILAAINLSSGLFYLLFASAERQPWATDYKSLDENQP